MLGANFTIDQYVDRLQDELVRVDQPRNPELGRPDLPGLGEREVRLHLRQRRLRHHGHAHSEDLGKSSLRAADLKDESKKRLKILSLTDNLGWILAVGNDVRLRPDLRAATDELRPRRATWSIAISGSGNSPNVLTAVDWANRHGLKTFGLTGYDGGKLRANGAGRPARAARRHGHGREHPPVPVPLGAQRRLRPHQRRRAVRASMAAVGGRG